MLKACNIYILTKNTVDEQVIIIQRKKIQNDLVYILRHLLTLDLGVDSTWNRCHFHIYSTKIRKGSSLSSDEWTGKYRRVRPSYLITCLKWQVFGVLQVGFLDTPATVLNFNAKYSSQLPFICQGLHWEKWIESHVLTFYHHWPRLNWNETLC